MKLFESLSTNFRKLFSIILMFIGMFGLYFAPWVAKIFFLAILILSFYVFVLDSKIEQKKKKDEEEKQKEQERQHRMDVLKESGLPIRKFRSDVIEFPIHTKARGVTFEGRQELLQQANDGDELVLIHKPTEKYPETIAIINKETYDIIGNVSSDLARQLVDEFGEGCKFYGEIVEITGGYDGKSYGCNLTIDGVE